jgi:hypothetical protein
MLTAEFKETIWPKNLKTVPNTRSLHSVNVVSGFSIQHAETSDSLQWTTFSLVPEGGGNPEDIGSDDIQPTLSSNKNVEVGEWILIQRADTLLPSVVTMVGTNVAIVKVMQPGNEHRLQWKWPQQEDIVAYPLNLISRKVTPPVSVSKRGLFVFRGERF